jgi:hypothetical protein
MYVSTHTPFKTCATFFHSFATIECDMGTTQRQGIRLADISFVIMVIQNGWTYAPVLVRRESFIRKVGRVAAQKTYQTAYAPTNFPSPRFVGSRDLF